ncbi:hypothetical protein OESDEN_07297 [Oesophagostomum dentatum]|uniref:Uncharacterized protein n=1 Tax=Oesophagostomum dentatum TaxID=61180 RepID=A0A0B1TAG6_OESDE|nr:hypothetical protein OESDEN_07297 [Oesophagostomum dentatum]
MSIIEPEPEKRDRFGFIARIFSRKPQQQPAPLQPLQFSSKVAAEWSKKPLAPVTCRYPTVRPKHIVEEREPRRHPKCERIQLSSSSECLNYGPIDPPECLPGKVEVIEEIRSRRKRRTKRKEIRTSTPVEHSDSAYSPSPVTDSNEEAGSLSEPEQAKDNDDLLVIEEIRSRRKRRTKRKEIRTSTPVEHSDSAYSPSPVTDSNEEAGSLSEPEQTKENHTYMNVAAHNSTQFEEIPTIICPSGQSHFPNHV